LFHECLAERTTKNERHWLKDKNRVVGLSNINPLLQKKAKVKPSKLSKAKLGVTFETPFKPTPSVTSTPKVLPVNK
jgi:hypothetical protein